MKPQLSVPCIIVFLFLSPSAPGQNYPDQHYVLRIDSLLQRIETSDGLTLSADGMRLLLQSNRIDGYVILTPQYAQFPFNQGLPSWNGTAPDAASSFKIQMRFPSGGGWSPWLTVGYWKANIWSSYGATSYAGGYVDVDYVKLNSYASSWQFKIIMTRTSIAQPSPSVHKLSFFVSDSRTTTSQDFNLILNDRPAAIFIPTQFIYQYAVDPQIGSSICSPTSVAMILHSYDIAVDPYQFALDTHDPHFDMFGVWPRVVQNASEYGLGGAVTRYRSWSQARDVLGSGGRISMSVGPPLYTGHLMMLAGFTSEGDPLVHDPAQSDGYSYHFSKSDLSYSWFDKGGIAYTFYPADTVTASAGEGPHEGSVPEGFQLSQNYPNPFNPVTEIRFQVPERARVTLRVYDLVGNEVSTLVDDEKSAGSYTVVYNGSGLASGVYFYRLQAGAFVQTKRMHLIK